MTKHQFVMTAAKVLMPKYGKREALRTAWEIEKWLEENTDPVDIVMLDDLRCCPKCLSGSWLMETPNGDVTCLRCNSTYITIE